MGYRAGYALGALFYIMLIAAVDLRAQTAPVVLAAPTADQIILQIQNVVPILMLGSIMGLAGGGAMALTKIDSIAHAVIRCVLGFVGGAVSSLILWHFVSYSLVGVAVGSFISGAVAWRFFRLIERNPGLLLEFVPIANKLRWKTPNDDTAASPVAPPETEGKGGSA